MPYSESDIIYNRRGELSPQQIIHLQSSWRQALRIGFVLAIVFFVIGMIFYVMGDRAGLVATWVFGAVILFALWIFNRVVRRVQNPGEVRMIRGAVQRQIENDEGTMRYFLRVGELRLTMEETDHPHFEDDQIYCVYYLPRTQYLVSAEAC